VEIFKTGILFPYYIVRFKPDEPPLLY